MFCLLHQLLFRVFILLRLTCFSQVLDDPFLFNYIRKEILGSWLVEMCVGLVGFTVEELSVCNAVVSFVLFSCLSQFDSLWPHGLQQSQAPLVLHNLPGVCSDSHSSSQWCYLTISYLLSHPSHFVMSFPSIRVFPKHQYPDYVFGYDPKFISKKIFLSFLCVGSWLGRW